MDDTTSVSNCFDRRIPNLAFRTCALNNYLENYFFFTGKILWEKERFK